MVFVSYHFYSCIDQILDYKEIKKFPKIKAKIIPVKIICSCLILMMNLNKSWSSFPMKTNSHHFLVRRNYRKIFHYRTNKIAKMRMTSLVRANVLNTTVLYKKRCRKILSHQLRKLLMDSVRVYTTIQK